MSSPRWLRAAAVGALLLTAAFLAVRAVSYYGFAPTGAKRHHVEAAAFLFAAGAALALIAARRSPPNSDEPQHALPVVEALLVAIAAVGFSSWAFGLGFLSDDFVLLTRAVEGRLAPGGDWPYFRPVPLLLWRGIASASDSPYWFHVFNALVHAANVVLVLLLADTLELRGVYRLAAAGLFAFWPAHLEAVAWASGVQDLLMTLGVLLFLLGAFACRWTMAMAGLATAIGSKETGITAPVLGVLFWMAAPQDRRPCASILGAAGALATAYAVWRVAFLPPSATSMTAWPGGYFLKELLGRPFATLVVPVAYDVVQGWPATAAACVLLLVALVCCAVLAGSWTTYEKTLPVRLTIAVAITVLPVYSLLHISPQLEGSRYVYLASAFWGLLLALFAQTLSRGSQGMTLAAHTLLSLTLTMWVLAHAWQRAPWVQAAKLRDAVLRSATTAATECGGEAVFLGAPDSVNGAYVFRNGLAEALARETSVRAGGSCRFVWENDRFVRAIGSTP